MYKLYCQEKNEFLAVPKKGTTVDVFEQEDGMVIMLLTPESKIEALIENSETHARVLWEQLDRGEVLEVSNTYLFSAIDAADEDEDEDEDEDKDTENSDENESDAW